jgi:hypothetical protein
METKLWSLAIFFAILDVATTAYGLSIGLAESNPLIAFTGNVVIVAFLMKILALTFGYMIGQSIERPLLAPIAFSLVWGLACINNIYWILQA